MPFYNILVFGYQPKTEQGLKDLINKLYPEATIKTISDEMFNELSGQIDNQLRDAQIDILDKISDIGRDELISRINNYENHKITGLSLQWVCDPNVGFSQPEDVIIGTPLTSRYYPTLLDWKYKNGGSDLCEINIEWLNIATKKLETILPKAKLFIVTVFA